MRDIVFTKTANMDPAPRLTESLRFSIAGPEPRVNYGVAHYPNEKSRFPDDLIRLSDEALYVAKRGGKNQVVSGDENMTEK